MQIMISADNKQAFCVILFIHDSLQIVYTYLSLCCIMVPQKNALDSLYVCLSRNKKTYIFTNAERNKQNTRT